MRGEIQGRIVQCWNPPWRLLVESGGDPTPIVQDLVDAVGMFYACASVDLAAVPEALRLDDPALDPLWAKVTELKVPVYLRAPDAASRSGAGQAASELPARHPGIRFLFTFRPDTDLAALLANHGRVYFTLSAFAAAAPPLSLVRRFPDRFVFASGMEIAKGIRLPGGADTVPFGALQPHFDAMRAGLATLPADVQDRVYRENLLGIF